MLRHIELCTGLLREIIYYLFVLTRRIRCNVSLSLNEILYHTLLCADSANTQEER